MWKDEQDADEHVTINEKLSTTQKEELCAVLGEFADTLKYIPGRTNLTEHKIDIGDGRPIRLPPYRLPHAYKEQVKLELQEMKASGIIEPSTTDWAAPIVLVKKTLRFCVDYRCLNSVARYDAYPMPRVDDLIDQLGNTAYITTLDLTRGYWQVPVEEKSRPMTTFVTPFGFYQFKMMPFGLSGAPATFQRLMDQVLKGLDGFSAAYLDDLAHLGKIIYPTHYDSVQPFERRWPYSQAKKVSVCYATMQSHCGEWYCSTRDFEN